MNISSCAPERVFHYFEEISKIPHGSGNTYAISEYLMSFARERGIEAYRDAFNNVTLIKNASKGYENCDAVILQGHMDMVCEKVQGCKKDMSKEGLTLNINGDWLYAEDTTLGGDDGIAVAMILAALEDDALPHPKIEAIITSDEEIGMLGAVGYDMSHITATRLINIDSEKEGVFTLGCAGGRISELMLPAIREDFKGTALKITVSGALGGHSGAEISKGGANASLVLGRVLNAVSKACDMRIVSVNGGLKDNAIPSFAEAYIISADSSSAEKAVLKISAGIINEYQKTDKDLQISCNNAEYEKPFSESSSKKIITLLNLCPNGVFAMSNDIPGLVQTSLNLGILKTEENNVSLSFCLRSSIESQKQMLADKLECLIKSLGGTMKESGDYCAWEYRESSPLRALFEKCFKEQYGKEPELEIIHAGVECGIFTGKRKELDCLSLGPEIIEIHTPRERISISSVKRTYDLVCEVLKKMKI